MPFAVVGLGSNLLPADEGYDGLVLRLEGDLAAIEVRQPLVVCGGGATLAAIVRKAADAGLSGIEFGCAIPGTVGGAVRMNAGAYGREMQDCLVQAVVVSAAGVRRVTPQELELRYRGSNVRPDEVVAHAVLGPRRPTTPSRSRPPSAPSRTGAPPPSRARPARSARCSRTRRATARAGS